MKSAIALFAFLAAFSLSGWAQEIDYDQRNKHIFCASHLTVFSESVEEEDQREALAYLSRMHREEALSLGAKEKHFDDVAAYLKKVRSKDEPKWNRLSSQSRSICLAS